MMDLVTICPKSGMAWMLRTVKGNNKIKIQRAGKTIEGESQGPNSSASGQIYFHLENEKGRIMLRVAKMTTISPMKDYGGQERHDELISKL